MQPLLLYIEVNLLCALILLLILIKVIRGNDMIEKRAWLAAVLLAGVAAFSLDIAWAFAEAGAFPVNRLGSFAINAPYYLFASFGSFCWFVYSERVQNTRFMYTKRGLALSAIPFLVSLLLVGTSYWTGWALAVDEDGSYERGSWYYVQFAIVYGYGAITAVHALSNAFKRENFAQRSQFLTLTYFAIFPLLFISLQAVLPGVPLTCVGLTFSLLWVFLNMQEQNISLDPLTQLNNRTHLARFVSQRMKHRDGGKTLCLYIVDVDRFKQINDTYGHVEGDRALQRVAEALRICSRDKSAFLARYGGDEFVIVKEATGACDARTVSDRVNAALAQLNEEASAPYSMAVSVGGAHYTSDIYTLQDFIRAADKELYEVKAARASSAAT